MFKNAVVVASIVKRVDKANIIRFIYPFLLPYELVNA